MLDNFNVVLDTKFSINLFSNFGDETGRYDLSYINLLHINSIRDLKEMHFYLLGFTYHEMTTLFNNVTMSESSDP
jgi:hypothetical protein